MVSWMICRLVVLVFGMLYPTYASYKAVKTKNIREYVRWMMYWIVFALFMAVETFTDVFISWFPFYYEIKMAFVLWLLSPYTKGASLLYRKFVHPSLSRHEKEIDTYIVQAKERSYETVLSFGKRGLNIAASAAVQAATKSQGALAGRLRSFSMQDLRTISDAPAPTYQDPLYLEDQVPHRRPPIGYRSGGLQDSDTEDECWSDTEVVPQPSARPREKPLGRTQSLRVVKRKPLVREVGGHHALPEGSDEEKDHAFRHGQLGSTEPGPVLPRALQGIGTVWRGPLAAHLACLHQLPGCCPPDSCCRLRAICGAAPTMHQSRPGSGFYLLSFSPLYLPRCGTRALPRLLKNETQSPPSCVRSFLSFRVLHSLLQGQVCVLVVWSVLVNEARFAEVLINKCVKVPRLFWFVAPVLTARVIKQPAPGQSGPGAKRPDRLPEGPSVPGQVAIDRLLRCGKYYYGKLLGTSENTDGRVAGRGARGGSPESKNAVRRGWDQASTGSRNQWERRCGGTSGSTIISWGLAKTAEDEGWGGRFPPRACQASRQLLVHRVRKHLG
ncbi:receptor expression-enhancing protein 4 isoform X1 [Sagmatias obliquidens]|uniref:receptor expression-enhancing protein 4 isoform X1 n=1 Tax=Sagmatias obliquidens TaxID=3371155 RepID=UPI000F43F82E|nr:receptor expression-enhancing protein 4 isoform X1 [Lagenorhynchus obliquidens]